MSNRIKFYTGILILILSNNISLYSQDKLKPGFDSLEYRQLLEISTRQADTPWTSSNVLLPYPEKCKMVYRSDSVGLDKRWDLWIRDDSVGIISIRGTILSMDSWAEDFYSPMVPAKGSIIIDRDNVFIYKLAESPLAYLLTSYLHYLDKERLPDSLQFKTYCSAPPKPGNLFYSYDFDFITGGGWALRVSNVEDWVPQCPLSVQAVMDFSTINPYTERDSFVVKMNFIDKIIFNYIVNELNNTLNDSRELLNEYFGKMVYEHSIKKYLPHFPEPHYTGDFYYYPCGIPVVLMKREGYDEVLKSETKIPELFKNHMVPAYYFLLNKIYFNK